MKEIVLVCNGEFIFVEVTVEILQNGKCFREFHFNTPNDPLNNRLQLIFFVTVILSIYIYPPTAGTYFDPNWDAPKPQGVQLTRDPLGDIGRSNPHRQNTGPLFKADLPNTTAHVLARPNWSFW